MKHEALIFWILFGIFTATVGHAIHHSLFWSVWDAGTILSIGLVEVADST